MNLRPGQKAEVKRSISVPAKRTAFVFDVTHLGIKNQKCSTEEG